MAIKRNVTWSPITLYLWLVLQICFQIFDLHTVTLIINIWSSLPIQVQECNCKWSIIYICKISIVQGQGMTAMRTRIDDILSMFKGGFQGYFFLENDFRDIDCTWRVYQGATFGKKFGRATHTRHRWHWVAPKWLKKWNFYRKVVELWFWLHLIRLEETIILVYK